MKKLLIILALMWNIVFGQYNDTLYFDRTGGGGGSEDGTITNPYDSISDALPIQDSTLYLLKAGETFSDTVEIEIDGNYDIEFNSYDSGERPILYHLVTEMVDETSLFKITDSCYRITIEGLHLKADTTYPEGIALVWLDGDYVDDQLHYITINNCELENMSRAVVGADGLTAVQRIYNYDFYMANCTIHGQGEDQIFMKDLEDAIFYNNWLYDVNQFWHTVAHNAGDAGGDNFQFDGDYVNLNIYNNIIDHRSTGNKYCLLAGNLTNEIPLSINVIGNTFYPPKDTILVGEYEFVGTGAEDWDTKNWLNPSAGEYFSRSDHYCFIIIDDGTSDPNTFKWSKDSLQTFTSTGVSITGSWQDIIMWEDTIGTPPTQTDTGYLEIMFDSETGHDLNDTIKFVILGTLHEQGGIGFSFQNGGGDDGGNVVVFARNKVISRNDEYGNIARAGGGEFQFDSNYLWYNKFDSCYYGDGGNFRIDINAEYSELFNNVFMSGDYSGAEVFEIASDSVRFYNNLCAGDSPGDIIDFAPNSEGHIDSAYNFIINSSNSALYDNYLSITDWETSDFTRTSDLNDGYDVGLSYDIDSTSVSNPPETGAYEYTSEAENKLFKGSDGKFMKTGDGKLIKL